MPVFISKGIREDGPHWDGDISPRRFLGSRETLDKLDRDNDGLLDRHEAMQKPAGS